MLNRRIVLTTSLSVAALGAAGYSLWPRLGPYEDEVARQRELLSENPDLNALIGFATLAANGHNAQPWKFKLGDASLSILPDMSRRTGVVDPDDHHLFVSLGCAAENFVIAAQATGRATAVETIGGETPRLDIVFDAAPAKATSLYQAIPLRQSTRSTFDGQPISATDMQLLEAAATQVGVAVQFFTQAPQREAILEMVVSGNSAQMDNPAFVTELREWLRFTPEQAMSTGDGLFAAASGNPVAPAWVAERLFERFFQKNAENDKYREHIRSSYGIAVFAGESEGPEHWMKVGRSFQRFALQATALGIRTAHINQPVEVTSIRSELASWLGQPDTRPDLIIRFGRAPALPMSLRRPVASVSI